MADKVEKVREMTMGRVIVGSWLPYGDNEGVEHFVPCAKQPPVGVDDAREVERWLKKEGIAGDFAMIREYSKIVRINRIEVVEAELVERAPAKPAVVP